jgi:plasmid stabilization system protein ParE
MPKTVASPLPGPADESPAVADADDTNRQSTTAPLDPRDQAEWIVRSQPADSSLDDILRALAFHRMVERGLADAEAGRLVPGPSLHAQIRRLMVQPERAVHSARLRWTAQAESSLVTVFESIAATRPETAQRTLESILHRMRSLAASPIGGRPYPFRENVDAMSYGHFRVAYQRVEGGITLLGVFHGLIFLPPA